MKLILILFLWPLISYSASPRIVVSFSILGDITHNIVPIDFSVEEIVSRGLDPHGYQLTAQDYIRIKKADLILLVGENFEPWSQMAYEKSRSKAKIYYVTKSLPLLPLPEHNDHDHHHNKGKDPHFWLSPQVTLLMIEQLSSQLQIQFPSRKSEIHNRTIAYLKKIQNIQNQYKKEFSKLQNKKMVIPHNSFQYFSKEFEVIALSPTDGSHSSDPSVKKIAHLTQKIINEKIKSLFLESSSPTSLMKSISTETQVPLSGTLYSDTLSKSDEASTYLKLLEHNLKLIFNSMKGTTP